MKARAKRGQRQLTHFHIHHLATGRDFFNRGFGDDLAGMRAAWRSPDVRDQVWSQHRSRWGELGKPWAAIAFDDLRIRDASDVPTSLSRYWEGTHPERARNAVKWGFANGLIDASAYGELMARLAE